MKSNRSLTEEELQIALIKLEEEIKIIREQNSDYFDNEKNPNSIDYVLAPGLLDWTGFTENNSQFFAFNPGLSEAIRQDVIKSFIAIVNDITNSSDV